MNGQTYTGIVTGTESPWPYAGRRSIVVQMRSVLFGERAFSAEVSWGSDEPPPEPGTTVTVTVEYGDHSPRSAAA